MGDTLLGFQNYYTTAYFQVTFIVSIVVAFVGVFCWTDKGDEYDA